MPETADGENQDVEDCKLEHVAHYAHHNQVIAETSAMEHNAITVCACEIKHGVYRNGLADSIFAAYTWHVSAEKQECQSADDDIAY